MLDSIQSFLNTTLVILKPNLRQNFTAQDKKRIKCMAFLIQI